MMPPPPIDIPHTELPADVLRAVVESFVLREGTDYGEKEFSLEDKVAAVVRQLERGEAQIVFRPRDGQRRNPQGAGKRKAAAMTAQADGETTRIGYSSEAMPASAGAACHPPPSAL